MAEARCELTELVTTECAHCLGRRSADEEAAGLRARLLASGRWFEAIWPGICEHCGERFAPGAAIRMSPGGWRADCCAEDEV